MAIVIGVVGVVVGVVGVVVVVVSSSSSSTSSSTSSSSRRRNNKVTIDRKSSIDSDVMITCLCLGANKTVTRFRRPEKRRMHWQAQLQDDYDQLCKDCETSKFAELVCAPPWNG